MKYYLESHLPDYECIIETKEYCLTLDDAINYIYEIIDDFIRDSFCVEEEKVYMGAFDEYDLEEAQYSNAIGLIQRVDSNLYFTSSIKSEPSSQTIRQTNIPVNEYILQRAQDLRDDSSFTALMASIVERSLLEFVKHSTWHVGLRNLQGKELEIQKGCIGIEWTKEKNWVLKGDLYYPVVWFGPSGYPSIPEWRICKDTEEEEYEFWFYYDTWSIIDHLGRGASEVFLVWYTAECGCTAPDVETIRNMCPIPIEEGETVSKFLEKTNQYIINNLI